MFWVCQKLCSSVFCLDETLVFVPMLCDPVRSTVDPEFINTHWGAVLADIPWFDLINILNVRCYFKKNVFVKQAAQQQWEELPGKETKSWLTITILFWIIEWMRLFLAVAPL